MRANLGKFSFPNLLEDSPEILHFVFSLLSFPLEQCFSTLLLREFGNWDPHILKLLTLRNIALSIGYRFLKASLPKVGGLPLWKATICRKDLPLTQLNDQMCTLGNSTKY